MMIHNNKISDNLISFTSKKLSGKIYPPADKSISHRSLLISSLAAAQSVMTIGNKETINKTKILKSLKNILK